MKTPSSGGVAARRAVIRWALRLLRREWRQQVLVTALVTVAAGAAVFGATAAYNAAPSRDAEFGSADHRFELNVSKPEALAPYVKDAAEWFGGVEVIRHRSVPLPGSTDAVELRSQDPDGAYGSPMLALRGGRFPASGTEIALTDRVAGSLGAGIGDAVVLDGVERTVVGLVENPDALDDEFALLTPTRNDVADRVTVLVQGTDDQVRSFRAADEPGTGFIESRGRAEKATAAVLVLVVATIALLLVSLVAAAGFVAVAHRRLRQLGMLAAVGATQRHLRLVMVANGAAVGAVAAVIGTGVALVGWLVLAPTLEGAAGHRIQRFDVPGWLVAAGAVLAVGTATVAAWLPARAAARVPIVSALSARPPRPAASHRSALVAGVLLAVGVVCLGTGVDPGAEEANPLLVIGGVVAAVVAVLFMAAPAIRILASLAGRMPVASRLALRDLARYQARSGLALGAISLGLGIAVSAVVIAAAAEHGADEGNLSDRQLLVRVGEPQTDSLYVPELAPADVARLRAAVDDLAATLDEPTVVTLEVAVDPIISEHRDLETVRPAVHLGRRVGESTLRDSGVVHVATPELLDHLGIDAGRVRPDTVLLTHLSEEAYLTGNISSMTFRRNAVPEDAIQRITVPPYSSVPRTLLTEHGLRVGGWRPSTAGWLVEARRPPSDADLVVARERAADAGLTIESRDEQGGLVAVRTGASVAGVLLALGILAMTVGLLRGESARDLRTLTAIGATSRTRRRLAAGTAGALALLAVILGAVTAYAALLAGYWPDTGRLANIPVVHLTAIGVGLPLLAAVAGWTLAGRQPADLARSTID